MKLKVTPQKAKLGQDVRLTGKGFPPGQVRITIAYEDRAESTKALVAPADHPKYEEGDLDISVRAERPGRAEVQVWDWAMVRLLAEGSFEVTDG